MRVESVYVCVWRVECACWSGEWSVAGDKDKQETSPLAVCPMVVRYRQTGRTKAQHEDLGSHSGCIHSLVDGTSTELQMELCWWDSEQL
jgi:hypothetical protein